MYKTRQSYLLLFSLYYSLTSSFTHHDRRYLFTDILNMSPHLTKWCCTKGEKRAFFNTVSWFTCLQLSLVFIHRSKLGQQNMLKYAKVLLIWREIAGHPHILSLFAGCPYTLICGIPFFCSLISSYFSPVLFC